MTKRTGLPDGVTINRRTIREALVHSPRGEWSERDLSRLDLMTDGELLAAANESRVNIPDDAVSVWTDDARAEFGRDGETLVANVNRSDRSVAVGSSGSSGGARRGSSNDDLSAWENRAGKLDESDE